MAKPKQNNNKSFLLIFLFVLIIIILFFGAKLYLLINLLIGNDTLVKLTVSQQDFYLNNSQEAPVEFKMFVSTNIFCEAVCEYTFKDISTGMILDKDIFNTTLANPNSKSYQLLAPEKGKGQDLYHFQVSCQSKETGLCKTTEKPIKRSILIALNYNLNENALNLRDKSIEKLNEQISKINTLQTTHLFNKYLQELLNEKIQIRKEAEFNITKLEDKINKSISLFQQFQYEQVLAEETNLSNITLEEDKNYFQNEISNYNSFVNSTNFLYLELDNLTKTTNMSLDNTNVLETLIEEYNLFAINLDDTFDLSAKTKRETKLEGKLWSLLEKINQSVQHNTTFNELIIPNSKPIIINFTQTYVTNLKINSENPICCYENICETCCDNLCENDETKYPILLLHGHSFNGAISAEKSLGDLRSIQEKLASDGFLDGGYIILEGQTSTETFKKTTKQMVFAGSYYFDIYKNTEDTVILETQSEDLNTYALRLNDIIKTVKLKTGRGKVIIVAHSMGGLVVRRYMQIFGENDVEKLIMIGTPNHGIEGKTLSTCPIFGSDIHCDAMDSKSLFINKLNYEQTPKIAVENIIGIGCDTDGVDGDGVVKNSSTYLSWANNHYISGSCSTFSFLHNDMLELDKYPEVYEIIKESLLTNSEIASKSD